LLFERVEGSVSRFTDDRGEFLVRIRKFGNRVGHGTVVHFNLC
jgi:hypothetical protein